MVTLYLFCNTILEICVTSLMDDPIATKSYTVLSLKTYLLLVLNMLPYSHSSLVSEHAHDAGSDLLGCHIRDELDVVLLHVHDQHHANQSDKLHL